MEEKSLINKEDISIFEKIKGFFRRLFYIKKADKETKDDIKQAVDIKQVKTSGFIDEFKSKQKIISLQQQYEAGIIAEENISEEDKQELIELYKEQINEINNNIKMYKNTLNQYKEQILEIKNKRITEAN